MNRKTNQEYEDEVEDHERQDPRPSEDGLKLAVEGVQYVRSSKDEKDQGKGARTTRRREHRPSIAEYNRLHRRQHRELRGKSGHCQDPQGVLRWRMGGNWAEATGREWEIRKSNENVRHCLYMAHGPGSKPN